MSSRGIIMNAYVRNTSEIRMYVSSHAPFSLMRIFLGKNGQKKAEYALRDCLCDMSNNMMKT